MHTYSLINVSTTLSRLWTTALLCACMALGVMAIPDNAHAASKKKTSNATASEPVTKKGSVKIKHQRSASEESPSERDRRLFRECKGRPNAGACMGYTQR